MFKCCCIRYPQPFHGGFHRPVPIEIPLISTSIGVIVQSSLSTFSISQEFRNNEPDPIECEYTFRIPEDSVITDLKLYLPDGTILTSAIEEAEKATEMYQDALSEGNSAVMSKSESSEKMTIFIGNLGPQESIRAEFTLVAPLSTNESFWNLNIPAGFIPLSPDYKLNLNFSVEIIANSPVTSYSSNYPLVWESDGQCFVRGVLEEKSKINLENRIWIKYKSEDTGVPSCIVQKLQGKYAALMSFVPFSTDEMGDDLEGTGEFIFLLDRSGSMYGDRINLAKRAAILFLKSLPVGSLFNIVSFGSYHEMMFQKSQKNTSANIEKSVKKIEYFMANMQGTDIYTPLNAIFSSAPSHEYPRIIFLLTDGKVKNADLVIKLIKKQAGKCRVHGFGIGDGVDPYLINQSAKAGRGCGYFINNNEELGKKVITALKQCILPCLNSWGINWPGESYPSTDKIGSVYYGEKCVQYILMDTIPDELPIIRCYDNNTKGFKDLRISGVREIQGEQIFKLWAKNKIDWLSEELDNHREEIIMLSKSFGIPCELTSFICIKENGEAVVGDMITRKVPIARPPRRSTFYERVCNKSEISPSSFYAERSIGGELRTKCAMKSSSIKCSMAKNLDRSNQSESKLVESKKRYNNIPMLEEDECKSQEVMSRPQTEQKMRTDRKLLEKGTTTLAMPIKKPAQKIAVEKDGKKKEGLNSPGVDKYMSIITAQLSEGYWEGSSLLKILPRIARVPKNFIESGEKDKVISTMYALCYLNKYFPERYDEWTLVEKKAVRWLKTMNVIFAENKERLAEYITN